MMMVTGVLLGLLRWSKRRAVARRRFARRRGVRRGTGGYLPGGRIRPPTATGRTNGTILRRRIGAFQRARRAVVLFRRPAQFLKVVLLLLLLQVVMLL